MIEKDEKCLVCEHASSQHSSVQFEGMWPCEVAGCTCMDICTSSGLEAMYNMLGAKAFKELYGFEYKEKERP